MSLTLGNSRFHRKLFLVLSSQFRCFVSNNFSNKVIYFLKNFLNLKDEQFCSLEVTHVSHCHTWRSRVWKSRIVISLTRRLHHLFISSTARVGNQLEKCICEKSDQAAYFCLFSYIILAGGGGGVRAHIGPLCMNRCNQQGRKQYEIKRRTGGPEGRTCQRKRAGTSNYMVQMQWVIGCASGALCCDVARRHCL